MRRNSERHRPQPPDPDLGTGPEDARARPEKDASVAAEHSLRIAQLFEAHNSALMRFLTCRLKSTQQAKEVAQEAYVRLLQLDAPGGVSYLQAFLFKTASNLAVDRIRSATRRERIAQINFFGETEPAPSPEAGVAAGQMIERVLAIVDELPPKCRYAFVMHHFRGHEYADVAKLMGISERMVRLYVERAVVFCRERLLDSGGAR
jgi:RNA polymerase sigma-70 factor (ECF subfamily)